MSAKAKRKNIPGGWLISLMLFALVLFASLDMSQTVARADDNVIRNERDAASYANLKTAIDAASSGDVLVLIGNTSLTENISNNKDLTINLNGYMLDLNGYNITNAGDLSLVCDYTESANAEAHYLTNWNGEWMRVSSGTGTIVELDSEDVTAVDRVAARTIGGVIANGVGTKAGGAGESRGGAIVNTTGNLTVKDICFLGCKADCGGAIANEGGQVTLTNVRGYFCSAKKGGFVYNSGVQGCKLMLTDCTAKACKVTDRGGVIFNLGEAEASGLKANACRSDQQGGVISNGADISASAPMKLSGCEFKYSGAVHHGGAIANFGVLEMTDSGIFSCDARAGAGIFNYNSLTINGGSISNCNAGEYGGAIFSDGILMHPTQPAKATDTITVLEGVRIEGCSSLGHAKTGENDEEHYDQESIYVRNSSFVMKSGYVENMIFARDKASYINDISTGVVWDGFPASDVKIHRGKFANYVPKAEHIAAGSQLVEKADDGFTYVVDQTFKTQPTPAGAEVATDQKHSVSWVCDGASAFTIMRLDQAKNSWEKFANVNGAGGAASYDFAAPGDTAQTEQYKVIALKDSEPIAFSEVFTITWKVVPAKAGSKLENTSDPGGEYVVTSNDGASPEVSYKPAAGSSKKTVTVGGEVVANGITYKVTSVAKNAFKNNKSVEKIKLTGSIKVVGEGAFSGCKKLKSVTIGKNVKELGKGAFNGCESLTTITIPTSVTKFGANLFSKMKKLKCVKFQSKKLKASYFNKKTFKGMRTAAAVKVPKAKVKAYKKMFKKKGLPKNVKVKKA